MVSIGFDAVADLSGLRFAFKGVRPGVVHPVTRAAAARAESYMLQDAPGGLFVILNGAPMGSLLAKEHVLLVGVQHVSGMWVLRGMRMGAYVAALRIEAHEVGRCGSLKQALQDAQQLAVGFPNGGGRRSQGQAEGVRKRHQWWSGQGAWSRSL